MQLAAMRAPRAAAPRAAAPRRLRLPTSACTYWQLAPAAAAKGAGWERAVIDLTGPIGSRRLCSVASADYAGDAAADFEPLSHGQVHLVFEAEGEATPLDSPSALFVTNLDCGSAVVADGRPVPKGERVRLRPGAALVLDGEEYVVLRDARAHA